MRYIALVNGKPVHGFERAAYAAEWAKGQVPTANVETLVARLKSEPAVLVQPGNDAELARIVIRKA